MADEFSQDDLDQLFKEVLSSGGDKAAPGAGGQSVPGATPPATPAPAGAPASAQDEIDALLAGHGAGAPVAKPEPAASKPASAGGASGGLDVSQDEIDALLGGLVGSVPVGGEGAQESADNRQFDQYQFSSLEGGKTEVPPGAIDLLRDVSLNVKIELGRAKMYIKEVLKLSKGSVVELDKLAGDPLDILVNDRLVAKGEVLVLNDNFCVRITEILSPQSRKDQEKS